MNKEAQRQNLLYARTSDKLCDAEAEIKQLKARITELETITDEKVERVARVMDKLAYDFLEAEGGFEDNEFYFMELAKAALEAAIGGGDE